MCTRAEDRRGGKGEEDGGRGRNRSSSDAASNGSWWLEGGSFPGVDDAAAGAQHEALEAHGVTDVPD